jgi:hypothetical protein
LGVELWSRDLPGFLQRFNYSNGENVPAEV